MTSRDPLSIPVEPPEVFDGRPWDECTVYELQNVLYEIPDLLCAGAEGEEREASQHARHNRALPERCQTMNNPEDEWLAMLLEAERAGLIVRGPKKRCSVTGCMDDTWWPAPGAEDKLLADEVCRLSAKN